jgi:phage host-nuclease inhibitor protein Gam
MSKVKLEMPTRETAIELIAEIGRRQREQERLQADMNDELAQIKEKYERLSDPHNQAIKEAALRVHLYCETHKKDLTSDGKTKTVSLMSGEVKWRLAPKKVNVRGTELVIKTFKKLGLEQFIRVTEEINKEAILADPKAIAGVKGINITQKEDFCIMPFETKLEVVA